MNTLNYMEHNPEKLWNEFIKSFEKIFKKSVKEDPSLLKKIIDRTEMTNFYKTSLFQEIAEDLDLKLSEKEFLRIDMIMLKKEDDKGDYPVPWISIESENDPDGDLPNEIYKLLSVNTPLKILMTRASLVELLKNDYEGHEDTDWYYPLQSFAEVKRINGYFAVISAEWKTNDKLTYKYIVYNDDGKRIGEIKEINFEDDTIPISMI